MMQRIENQRMHFVTDAVHLAFSSQTLEKMVEEAPHASVCR